MEFKAVQRLQQLMLIRDRLLSGLGSDSLFSSSGTKSLSPHACETIIKHETRKKTENQPFVFPRENYLPARWEDIAYFCSLKKGCLLAIHSNLRSSWKWQDYIGAQENIHSSRKGLNSCVGLCDHQYQFRHKTPFFLRCAETMPSDISGWLLVLFRRQSTCQKDGGIIVMADISRTHSFQAVSWPNLVSAHQPSAGFQQAKC